MTLCLVPALFFLIPRIRFTLAHWFGAAFLAWAALSLLWTPILHAGIAEIVKLALMGCCFVVGAELDNPKPVYKAIVFGTAISGALAILQTFGWEFVPQLSPPAGLFVNRNYLAEIGVVATILAFGNGIWWAIPFTACAALLPHSRGALSALLLVGFLWVWRRSRALALVAALGVTGAVGALYALEPNLVVDRPTDDPHVHGSALDTRADVWMVALRHLDIWGHGVGSFMVEYPLWTPHPSLMDTRPAQAHNEAIHEAAELGLPGVVLLAGFFACCLRGRLDVERFALVALLAISLWSFPFHLPATGALAGLVAGRLARSCAPLRHVVWLGRAASRRGAQLAR